MALLANADAALYRAKADGGHALRHSIPRWIGASGSATRCSTTCARRSRNGELLLHYQPQAKIDGEVFGFEALVRWQSPKHGLVSPGTFIPLAEQNGTIVEIGEWTLREACREAASWDAAAADRRQSLAGAVPLRRSRRPRPPDPAGDRADAGAGSSSRSPKAS